MRKINEEFIRGFTEKHNINIVKEEDYDGGKKLCLEHCVFDTNHNGSSAVIIITKYDTVQYCCKHNSCANHKIADFIKEFEPDFFKENKYSKDSKKAAVASTEPIKLVPLSSIEEVEQEWLIPCYIPKGQITLLAGDGGTGKTALWCDIAASISTGCSSIFDEALGNPFAMEEPETVAFFSSEDSVKAVLKARLRKAGADMERILLLDITDKDFERIKFDSEELEQIIKEYHPAVAIFDPLQSFIPANIQMGARNAMRQCLNPLISLGEKYGTTFIIIMHTNKKLNVSGRSRVADSSDIWDIARSVLIAGHTGEEDVRYVSHEKCNYGALQDTILYTVDDGGCVVFEHTTYKKDRDFMLAVTRETHNAPARDEAKEQILQYLSDGEEHKTKDMDDAMKAAGISFTTLKRAKRELKQEGRLKHRSEGFGTDKVFYVKLVEPSETSEESPSEEDTEKSPSEDNKVNQ